MVHCEEPHPTAYSREVPYIRRCVATITFSLLVLAAHTPTGVSARIYDPFVVTHITTNDPVVFITIDDGTMLTDEALQLIVSRKIPIATFGLPGPLHQNRQQFRRLRRPGSSFENHTTTHQTMAGLPYPRQTWQICSANLAIKKQQKKVPRLFRPPGGAYDDITIAAAKRCGMEKIVLWNVEADRGVIVRSGGGLIQRGDIIVMHYLHSLTSSLDLLMKELKRLGLHPGVLREYIAETQKYS